MDRQLGFARQRPRTVRHAALLLRHSLELVDEADCIERAVSEALHAGAFTADLASTTAPLSTRAATRAVLAHLCEERQPIVMRD